MCLWYNDLTAEGDTIMSREPKVNPEHSRKANQKMKPFETAVSVDFIDADELLPF